MVQKRETKPINKLCVREILSLSFVCGAYFFELRARNLVCFVIAYNLNGKYAPEAGKTRMGTAFFTCAIDTRGAWLIDSGVEFWKLGVVITSKSITGVRTPKLV